MLSLDRVVDAVDLRRIVDAVDLGRTQRRVSVLPLLAVLLLGSLVLALPPYRLEAWHVVAVAAMGAALLGLHAVAVHRLDPRWASRVAPFAAFPLVALLRDASGGSVSGLSPLLVVPVVWLALFGSRRDLWVASAMVALVFVAPLLLVGGERYAADEWRRAVLWTGLSAVIAPVLQQVVARLQVETRRNRAIAARLEGIIRGATLTGLVTTDLDGAITSFGVGAEGLLGHRADRVLGRRFDEVCLDRDEVAAAAQELGVEPGFGVLSRLAHQQAASRDWTMLRADGERVFVRMAVTELRDEHGQVTGLLVVAIDTTESVRSRLDLVQAEQRWRVLMDHLPDTTVIMVEERTGVTLVTGAGVLVRRLRDAPGRRLAQIVDAGRPGALAALLEQAFAGQEPAPLHADVDGADHELTASPLPSTTGRRQALVMVRDVSRDRQRERTLTAAKERAERLFEDAPQGVALLDRDGVVTQANPALRALLGAADLVGRPLADWSLDPSDETVRRHLGRVAASGDHRAETQWTLHDAEGEELHVVLISTMLVDEAGGEDRVLTNVVDVSERYRYERRLAYLAEHDPLTGLANRRRFDLDLQRHVEECLRYGPRGALLMIDLDRFKAVNDTLGHAAGDALLVDVAHLLAQRLRSTDVVARLGGDEFAILLPHADGKAAERVAASVVERVHALARRHDDARAGVTVSIGGVVVDLGHHSASDLLSAADAAMYVAKQSGRNRWSFGPVLDGGPAATVGDSR